MFLNFIVFRFLDFVDIFIVAIMLYQLYRLVKGTVAINIFVGVLAFYLLWITVRAFNMQLLSGIIRQVIDVGVIALIIVFQQEIRRYLLIFTDKYIFKRKNKIESFLDLKNKRNANLDTEIILNACVRLSADKIGALIVIENEHDLSMYFNSGEKTDSTLSSDLLISIFFKNNPLHDGAVIISQNRIAAARCVLPGTVQRDLPAELGMRHRAAIGMSEQSDCMVIIISEQTGVISYSHKGEIVRHLNYDSLKKSIEKIILNNEN